jgi:hypothetical protein
MKQIKVLYNNESVGFFVLNDLNQIMNYGFHIDDVNIIDYVKNEYPLGTKIILDDNYFRINK